MAGAAQFPGERAASRNGLLRMSQKGTVFLKYPVRAGFRPLTSLTVPVADGPGRMLAGYRPLIRPLVGPALGHPALSGPWSVLEATSIGVSREGSDMGRKILIVLAVLFLALSATAIVYVLGIRSQSSTVRNAARRFHHTVGNRVQMRSAGTRGTLASVIRHQGRRTGNTYETPVWAVPTEDGFMIAIVYGSRSDWLKNVMASGRAAIVHNGETYAVNQPEVVPMETARAYFPATLQRTHRLIRIDCCLRVRRVKVENTATA